MIPKFFLFNLFLNFNKLQFRNTLTLKILNKVKDALKNQNITQGKIDETYIYIKPSDKKAYYVTPDEVTDSVEL